MKKKIHLICFLPLFAALLLTVGCKSSAPAPGPRGPAWVKLGERIVNFRADHDEILVTGERGAFRAVKLRVLRAPIFLNSVAITYGNGNTHRVNVNKRIPAGSETRPLNLPGEARIIRKVAFNYRTGPAAKVKATMVLLGRR